MYKHVKVVPTVTMGLSVLFIQVKDFTEEGEAQVWCQNLWEPMWDKEDEPWLLVFLIFPHLEAEP